MEKSHQKIINAAMPRLVDDIIVSTKLKIALLSGDIFPDDVIEQLLQIKPDEEMLFQMLQKLKKVNTDGLPNFIAALRNAEQKEVADYLANKLQSDQTDKSQTSNVPQVKEKSTNAKSELEKAASELSSLALSSSRSNQTLPKETSMYNLKKKHISSSTDFSAGGTCDELRRALTEMMAGQMRRQPQPGDVVIALSYKLDLIKFVKGRRDTPPGPLRGPDLSRSSAAFLNTSITTLAPECAAALRKLLGGSSKFVATLRNGVYVLTSFTSNETFVSVALRFPGSQENLDAWFNMSASIFDCAAATMGNYPTRASSSDRRGHEREIGGGETVAEWFEWSRTIEIDIQF